MADKDDEWAMDAAWRTDPTVKPPSADEGYHWVRAKNAGWKQEEDPPKLPEGLDILRNNPDYRKKIGLPPLASQDFDFDTPVSSQSADTDTSSPAKTVKMPTRPGQQSMVTMDTVKAAGFDNLRDYLNAQQGLVRRKETPVAYKEMSLANSLKSKPKYAKGGKINLDACGVSTHTPSKKKHANW
jgi:hypothetical protein